MRGIPAIEDEGHGEGDEGEHVVHGGEQQGRGQARARDDAVCGTLETPRERVGDSETGVSQGCGSEGGRLWGSGPPGAGRLRLGGGPAPGRHGLGEGVHVPHGGAVGPPGQRDAKQHRKLCRPKGGGRRKETALRNPEVKSVWKLLQQTFI